MMLKNKKQILKLLLFILALLISGAVMIVVGLPLVKFAEEPEKFRLWVDAKGFLGKLAFVLMMLVQTVLALIPGEPFELVAGYAFGTLEGTLLCLISTSLGGIIIFLLVRRFGARIVELFFNNKDINSISFLKTNPKRSFLLFVIFMTPGTPKDLICYYAGLTDISFSLWVIICTVGRVPSIITSTLGGGFIGTKDYVFAIVVFGITLLISLFGVIVYRIICKRNKREQL